MYTRKMAKVMKKFNPFNRSTATPNSTKTKEPVASPTDQENQECTGDSNGSDLVNRRKVSISKSGRYRENHKRRSALRHNNDDDIDKENQCATHGMSEKDKKNWENRNKQESFSNNNDKNNNKSINNINLNANVSTLGRHSSLGNYDTVSSLDGHAVAEEIECLAKSMTMENSSIMTAI